MKVRFSLSLIATLFIVNSGCTKFTPRFYAGSNSSSSSTGANNGPVTLSAAAYQATVYKYVVSQNCTNCHSTGPTASSDWFAQSDVNAAFAVATKFVNISNVSASLFAIQVSNNHCGFPNICGINNQAMLSALNQWIAQSTANSGSTAVSPSSSSGYGSVFVPANQSLLLRLNVGLNLPGQKTFSCQKGSNCSAFWANSGQYNVNFNANPNLSNGANQVSLGAFAGCNDIKPSVWGVNVSSTVSAQTANLIAAGTKMVDIHTGGLGSNSTFQPQVAAAFQALISDPSYASANVQTVFVGICTAAQTFGIGMKGF